MIIQDLEYEELNLILGLTGKRIQYGGNKDSLYITCQ